MRPPRAQPRMMNPWAGGPAPPDLPRQPGWDHADFAPQYPNNWRGFYPPPPRTVPAWWKPEVAQADPRYYGALPPQPPAQRSFAWRQDPQTRYGPLHPFKCFGFWFVSRIIVLDARNAGGTKNSNALNRGTIGDTQG